jgi:hypothetical protein
VFPSDLPGVNPTTFNGMLLYYRLMTKWSGLGDSTELSRVGLSHAPPGERRVVVAVGGRGREEEAGGADLRRRQRWERLAEERRLCEVGFQQVGFYPCWD